MAPSASCYQLRCNSDTVSGLPDASFQDCIHAECFGNLGKCPHPSPGMQRKSRAIGDSQTGNLRQRIEDLFRKAVAEPLVVFAGTHVGKRQHSN